jgi:anti-sigma28 factor (negative regulator of flagellin synthesis)
MKVHDKSPVEVIPAATPQVVSGSGARADVEAGAKVEPRDKVSVPAAQDAAALHAVQASLAYGRAARVAQIISAVKNGQYYPSPQQIANQLVAEAEVSARLAVMLKM